MNLNKLNDWLQLAAALGVIAGMIFVVLELRQNSFMLRVQLNEGSVMAHEELVRSAQQDSLARVLAKSYSSPLDLTVEDRIILHGHYEEAYLQVFREWLFVVRGVYSDGQLDGYYEIFAVTALSTEYGRAWWGEYKKELKGSSGLTAPIDDYVRERPPENPLERLRRVEEAVSQELGKSGSEPGADPQNKMESQ